MCYVTLLKVFNKSRMEKEIFQKPIKILGYWCQNGLMVARYVNHLEVGHKYEVILNKLDILLFCLVQIS